MSLSRKEMIESAPSHRELFEKFSRSLDKGNKQTKQTYLKVLRNYINYLEEKRIEKPDDEDVTAFKQYLRTERNCHSATIQLHNVVLKRFYQWCALREYYPDLSMDLEREKIEPTFVRRELSIEQANILLDNLSSKIDKGGIIALRDYTIIFLILNIGLRTIEVSRANIEDLRIENGMHVLYVQGKGHTEKDAPIRLENDVYGVIADYLEARKNPKSGPLFINHGNRKKDDRIKTITISKLVKESLREIGIDSKIYTAHSLRHTCATIALLKGASLEEVQALLRHKSINTTMIYLHTVTLLNNKSQTVVLASLHKRAKKETNH